MPDIVVVSEDGNNLTVQEVNTQITVYDGKFNGASLGATTVTTINKITITPPASGATLTIEEGFTLTASGNADVSGTNTGDDATNTLYEGKLTGITMANLDTGILKNTTGTGEPSIAIAADFPTLNQNTTGTAGGLTTTLVVASGGTGLSTLTDNNVILGNGASPVTFVAPGTAGFVLTSDGTTWTSAASAGGISNIDGGSSISVYLNTQNITGGDVNGD